MTTSAAISGKNSIKTRTFSFQWKAVAWADQFRKKHDDVIKWKHFPRYWPFVRGIHRSPVNSRHKGQWRGALMFTLSCVRINGWVNNCETGDLRRNRGHYDVIVMNWPENDHTCPLSPHFTNRSSIYFNICRTKTNQAGQQKFNMSGWIDVSSNLWYNSHQSKKRKCFSSRLAVVLPNPLKSGVKSIMKK